MDNSEFKKKIFRQDEENRCHCPSRVVIIENKEKESWLINSKYMSVGFVYKLGECGFSAVIPGIIWCITWFLRDFIVHLSATDKWDLDANFDEEETQHFNETYMKPIEFIKTRSFFFFLIWYLKG